MNPKLNPNTPWMKQNYKKTININYYYYLPSMNHILIHGNPIHLSTLLSQPHFWEECEDDTHTLEMGLRSPPGLPKLQSSIVGSKHLALRCFSYHWKATEM